MLDCGPEKSCRLMFDLTFELIVVFGTDGLSAVRLPAFDYEVGTIL